LVKLTSLTLFFLIFQLFNFSNLLSQNRFEIDIAAGYSRPLLEAYGTNVVLSETQDQMFIDGKRLIVSDNLGTDVGYTVQVYGKYSLIKPGFLKILMNIGYNRLYSIYPGPGDDFGVRVQSFSVGTGLEVCPLAKFRISPSIFGLLRYNLVGGESYHHAGLDFFKATSRFGYSAGFKVSYGINSKIGIFTGWSYNYDNLWNKEINPDEQYDAHVIPFRDKADSSNGLTHDRRVAYASYFVGMTFYFK
jgi:hypothetical protein